MSYCFCIGRIIPIIETSLANSIGIEQSILDDKTTSNLIIEGQDLDKREKNKKRRLAESEIPRELRLQAVPSRTSSISNFARREADKKFSPKIITL